MCIALSVLSFREALTFQVKHELDLSWLVIELEHG